MKYFIKITIKLINYIKYLEIQLNKTLSFNIYRKELKLIVKINKSLQIMKSIYKLI